MILTHFELKVAGFACWIIFCFGISPARLIELFSIAHNHDADVHPNTLQRVTRSLSTLDAKTRNDALTNRQFLDILTSRKNPERVLRLMNESGVFGRFLPDFGSDCRDDAI